MPRQLKPIALALVILGIGPAMYVFSRAHSLANAFRHVQVGDTAAQVTAMLGRPGSEVSGSGGNLEYRYTSWPIPTVWKVRFSGGKVVEKTDN
jgi:hypothetical protein